MDVFWFATKTRAEALLMEGALIRAMMPVHNISKQRIEYVDDEAENDE